MALGLIHLAPSPAIAQDVGDRVRVTVGESRLIGEVSHASTDGFMLVNQEGTSLEIKRSDIRQLELHSGTRNYKWWGLAGGYLLGAVFVEATKEDVTCTGWLYDPSCGYTRAGWLVGLGAPVVGFILGWRIRGEKWETIPHASAAGPTLSPAIGVRTYRHAAPSVYVGMGVRLRNE